MARVHFTELGCKPEPDYTSFLLFCTFLCKSYRFKEKSFHYTDILRAFWEGVFEKKLKKTSVIVKTREAN